MPTNLDTTTFVFDFKVFFHTLGALNIAFATWHLEPIVADFLKVDFLGFTGF